MSAVTLVATLQRRGRFWTAEPLFPQELGAPLGRRSPRKVTLPSNRLASKQGGTAREGDIVLVGVGAAGKGRGGGRARLLKVLGRSDVARDVIEALMLDRGLARRFDPVVEREAADLRPASSQARRDLRKLPTFTIDPITARDFDDAISAERVGADRWRVWVHIADVAAYVQDGSQLDAEARKRALSVYVPGAVEPMLPQALSNDACSLVPGRDRLTVTVEMEVEGERVVGSAFYRSTIRSDERLDYDRVDRIFAGSERASDPWAGPLAAAREAASALGRARTGALTLDSPEPEFAFDAKGNVSEIAGRVQTESHTLIEHLMIAANEQVAQRLASGGVPCLYRVHESPQPERVQRLVDQLASLGVPTPPTPKHMSASQAKDLLSEVSHEVDAHVRRLQRRSAAGEASIPVTGGRLALTALVLRSLQQAVYSPRNIGHAGLGSDCYCHFTSPIRRYPDIVCHRALLSTIGESPPPRAADLAQLGEWTSQREREAMVIERDSDDVARCFALERELYEQGWDEELDGEVTGLISAGAFIAFGPPRAVDGPSPPPFEGMLPVRRMRDAEGEREWWELNEEGTIMRGERTGQGLRLGQAVKVRVARIDAVRGRVDLAPASGPARRVRHVRGR